jgi:hypothetical protein
MPTSPAHGREGDNGPSAIGRGISIRAVHLSDPHLFPDMPKRKATTRNTNDLYDVLTS